MVDLKLKIAAKHERIVRAWCRRWYPSEAYGFLLGTVLGDSVEVDHIWLPSEESARRCFSPETVFAEDSWVHEIAEICEEEGWVIVGDFHSHTYSKEETKFSPVQSAFDLDRTTDYAIFGLCNVEEQKNGRLTTRLRWWGPSIKVRRLDE